MNNKLLKLIFKELDSTLTEIEKAELTKGLAESEELQIEREKILKMRMVVAASSKESFKPFFAERILQKINKPSQDVIGFEAFVDFLVNPFRKITLTAAFLVLILISYNLGISGDISLDGAFGIPRVSVEDALDPISFLLTE
jgi:hypothetical protein